MDRFAFDKLYQGLSADKTVLIDSILFNNEISEKISMYVTIIKNLEFFLSIT